MKVAIGMHHVFFMLRYATLRYCSQLSLSLSLYRLYLLYRLYRLYRLYTYDKDHSRSHKIRITTKEKEVLD